MRLLSAPPNSLPTGQGDWQGAGAELLKLALGVLAFAAVLIVCWLLLRMLKRRGGTHGAGSMDVLERMPLGPSVYLAKVRVNGRVLLICVGKESAGFICELEENAPAEPPLPEQLERRGGFWARFGHNILVLMGLRKEAFRRPERSGLSVGGQEGGIAERRAPAERADAPQHEALVAPAGGSVPVYAEEPTARVERLPVQEEHVSHAPISASNDVERSGYSRVDGKKEHEEPPRAPMDYQAALERMRRNAQIISAPPGQVVAHREEETLTESDGIGQAEPGEAARADEQGTPRRAAQGFAEALEAADKRLAPVAGDLVLTRSVPGKDIPKDELDALFDSISRRRERMDKKAGKRKDKA